MFSATRILRLIPLAALTALILHSGLASAVPSFARQTGLACEGCHTVFPELTPFGRAFKMNGYVIDNLPQVQGLNPEHKDSLLLNWLPPISLMFQGSYTSTRKALPDIALPSGNAQNGQVLLPQQASIFYAGRIAPNFGGFIQMTYDSASGAFGWDNTDIRYANMGSISGHSFQYGVSVNNNPTVQDVWNSTPAWQTPFDQRSSAAPMPMASAQIDGNLGGNVAGMTAYAYWMNSLYTEIGAYRSSPQGFSNNDQAGPLNSTASDVISGTAPYWRVAYERQWDRNSLAVGTYGLDIKLFPGDGNVLSGPTDEFRDTAIDAQYQYIGDNDIVSVQGTYIHERQDRDASVALGLATNSSDRLNTARVGASYYYQRRYGASFGVFSTTGSNDSLLYGAEPVFGSASGSPDSRGWTGEVDYLPWQNVKLALQYTGYTKFNGASDNYDGSGRNASDNNTLYLLGWLNF